MKTNTNFHSVASATLALLMLLALFASAQPVQAQVAECVSLTEGAWADDVDGSAQGLLNNGGPITDLERTNPSAALGEENWNNGGDTGFFSLGFGGSITLLFDEYVLDVPGPDLTVYEATNGDTYPLEEVEVQVSQDGSVWKDIANANNLNIANRTTELDFSGAGLAWIQYVKLTDVSDGADHDETADGFDVDAVFAESAACDEPSDEGSITITKVYGVDGEWSFDFTGDDDLAFALTNTEPSETFVAEAGVYTFTEVLSDTDATDLLDITCSQGASVVTDVALGTAVVTLAADEDVTCTFTNRPADGDDGGGDGGSDDLTCSLDTDDSSVSSGEDFTLTWTTANADSASIDNGIGDVALNGSVVTSIEDDTTFTLTAVRSVDDSEDEETVQCSVEVERRSSGGGGGTRVRDRGNDDSSDGDGGDSDDGDAPEGQVLGEQVSVVPETAPATGAGGAAPAASYAYFGAGLFVRNRVAIKNR